jgi:predicted polyphosphate/ATP-dependent NAD kinase
MGETVSRQLGFTPRIVNTTSSGITTADDTIRAAVLMQASRVGLILFTGGDGTARDIYKAVGVSVPVLGIPAGVKIHSAVFATHPRCAGELAADYLRAKRLRLREAEVVDLDEDMYRKGCVATRLFGYLKIPYRPHLVQNQKVPSPAAEVARLEAIAADVIENMQPGWLYILGPGTTTRAIAARLGLPKTLIGVDVITSQESVALDVSESRLLELVKDHSFKIIVTPIGGQGFLFGRGNQPISPQVIQQAGRENIIVVSLIEKINTLGGNPLLVDTGEPAVDALLVGHCSVITGYHERLIYRVAD